MTFLDISMLEKILLAICIFVIMYLISRLKKKDASSKKFATTIKTYEQALGLMEDAIVIFSNDHKVIYYNNSMKKYMAMKKDEDSASLLTGIEIDSLGKWVTLDSFLVQRMKNSAPNVNFPVEVKLRKAMELMGTKCMLDTFNNEFFILSIKGNQANTPVVEDSSIEKKHIIQSKLQLEINKMHEEQKDQGGKFILISIELDDVPLLRSKLGYGDMHAAFAKVSRYLQKSAKDFSYRSYDVSYDNFILLIPQVETRQNIVALIETIQNDILNIPVGRGERIHLSLSAGVSSCCRESTRFNMLDNAYSALEEGQKKGIGSITFYKKAISINENDVENGICNDLVSRFTSSEFILYYQPIADMKSGQVAAAEALLYWEHSKYGLLSPEKYMCHVEKSNMIVKLGQYLIEQVCKQQKQWEVFGIAQTIISIHLTARELESENFMSHIKAMFVKYETKVEFIRFEISESLVLNEAHIKQKVKTLRALGLTITIAEFGAGDSSFEYLKDFPMDILKIDKRFVNNIEHSIENQKLVKAMTSFGHSLGLKVTIDGIDDKRSIDIVKAYKAEYMQGNYFSAPMPLFEFQNMLRL